MLSVYLVAKYTLSLPLVTHFGMLSVNFVATSMLSLLVLSVSFRYAIHKFGCNIYTAPKFGTLGRGRPRIEKLESQEFFLQKSL